MSCDDVALTAKVGQVALDGQVIQAVDGKTDGLVSQSQLEDVGNLGSGSAYAEVSVLVHLHRVKDEPLAIARLLKNQGRRVVGALHSAFDLKFVAVTCRQQGYGNHHQDDLLHCICVVNIAILKNRAKLHLFSHPAKSRHEKWTSIPPSG